MLRRRAIVVRRTAPAVRCRSCSVPRRCRSGRLEFAAAAAAVAHVHIRVGLLPGLDTERISGGLGEQAV
jgi:hypothetical protein